MEPKRNYKRRVKSDAPPAQMAADLAKIGTTDLWEMLETNLHRQILAWEGNVPAMEQERRSRLCLAIVKEVRSRGVQLRLQF